MNSPRSPFPLWIFIVTDLALIGVAAVLSAQAPRPFSQATILWVVTCVVLGVIVGLVPIIWHFERKKNEALDDRQRALEALARTVSSSAEQISIATGGLHEIADLAQKNLRQADQLPHRLQEKIAEFQVQLSQANDVEKEELERELLALRTSETERLEAASQRIAKTSAEWVKLEALTAQHLLGVSEGLARLSQGTTDSISRAHATATQALEQAHLEAARRLGEASSQAVKAIEAARAAALDNMTERLTALITSIAHDAATQVAARLASGSALLEAQISRLETSRGATETAPGGQSHSASTSDIGSASSLPAMPSVGAAVEPAAEPRLSTPSTPDAFTAEAAGGSFEPSAEPAQAAQAALPVVKRPRKAKREESSATISSMPTAPDSPAPQTVSDFSASVSTAPANPPLAELAHGVDQPSTTAASEPASLPPTPAPVDPVMETSSQAVQVTPNAAALAVPPPSFTVDPAALTTPTAISTANSETDASGAPPMPGRKRAAKKAAGDDTPSLDLGLEENDFGESHRHALRGILERVLTSDGATRLLVTAYIGIGNRLFIRGEGPGLSWERGIPLEFVSIGKWRWQTNDATQPIQFKIYKNDELECPSLGKQTVEPGYQQEVTAGF